MRRLCANGEEFDFIVGVCDSASWLERCGFLKLGEYRKMISVSDLHGETLMMVKRGDSAVNDRLRDDLTQNHPQIRIEDTPHFYDIDVFNRRAEGSQILLTLECRKDIHPSLVSIPVDWDYAIPYGLLYPKTPSRDVLEFLDAVRRFPC